MELIDRLYQCASHLGYWVEIPGNAEEMQMQFGYWDETTRTFNKHDEVVYVYFIILKCE
jgi:hypothetical protein